MFSPDAKAATLLESYQVLAAEVQALAELEASQDIPDEDVARAITYIGRAMAELASARAFCVDLCETPKAPRCRVRDLPPDERTDLIETALARSGETPKAANPEAAKEVKP